MSFILGGGGGVSIYHFKIGSHTNIFKTGGHTNIFKIGGHTNIFKIGGSHQYI